MSIIYPYSLQSHIPLILYKPKNKPLREDSDLREFYEQTWFTMKSLS